YPCGPLVSSHHSSFYSFFFFYFSGDQRDLLSFPTRRSSDLTDILLSILHLAFMGLVGLRACQIISTGKRQQLLRAHFRMQQLMGDRKSTRLNSSHVKISYAVFCLKKKKKKTQTTEHTTKNSN